ncbi:hypothetical protein Pfo_022975, partial [Paulownia fortunei]
PGLLTRACNPSGGINLTGRWAGPSGWILVAKSGPSVPSGELGPDAWAEGLGFVTFRMEGTALGWFHRAATTSCSLQWKDYGLVLLGFSKAIWVGPDWTVIFFIYVLNNFYNFLWSF